MSLNEKPKKKAKPVKKKKKQIEIRQMTLEDLSEARAFQFICKRGAGASETLIAIKECFRSFARILFILCLAVLA